ncbi:MAG: response regulator [Planctomycetota bacterium]
MAKRRKILFLDDDPNVLEGLRRTFRAMRKEWALAFAQNGREGLDLLDRVPFDVVVCDLQMRGMDGAEVLQEVISKHPHVVRIVLSGQFDRDLSMKTVNPAHQYLSKPYNSEKLISILNRAMILRDQLTDDKLKSLVSQMKTIPSMPALYVELIDELNSEDASIQKVGEIISKDVGMTAKILQLVNSAFFGTRQNISNLGQAVTRLGMETIQGLVMSVQIFSQMESGITGSAMTNLWDHSMATGNFSREIAKEEGADRTMAGDAFISGMLHDSGKLILAANLPERYGEVVKAVQEQKIPMHDAELMEFGTTHAEVGAYLLALWGLPNSIVEAIAFHHHPSDCKDLGVCPLTFVHAGNVIDHALGSMDVLNSMPGLDPAYIDALNLTEKLPKWKGICQALTAPV